jgi:hypothetical protein
MDVRRSALKNRVGMPIEQGENCKRIEEGE